MSGRCRVLAVLLIAWLPAIAAPIIAGTAKSPGKTILDKKGHLWIEQLPDGSKRVGIQSEVCLREGPLELLLCKAGTKEHESILTADVDARLIHAALLSIGAKAGSPVQYQPKYVPARGSTVKVTVEYQEDGRTVRRSAKEWIRNSKTMKDLDVDWVFGGSQLINDPDDPNKVPFYAANNGDVICVANFPDAMLDLPITSSREDAERSFEATTDRIPPKGTKVIVYLEVVPGRNR
jgi:hypothetical protein